MIQKYLLARLTKQRKIISTNFDESGVWFAEDHVVNNKKLILAFIYIL